MSGGGDDRLVHAGEELSYSSVRHDGGAQSHVRCRIGEAMVPQLGSIEFFLLERYYLYNVRGEQLQRGQVHHVAYPAHVAEALSVSDGLLSAAGLTGVATRPPSLVHYSPGVDVEVFSLRSV
jgi:uncharacterized protein YqjF (DUF2071 family)